MERNSYENLNKFIEKVKNTGFWGWLFSWREIRALSYNAHAEFEQLRQDINKAGTTVTETESKTSNLMVQLDGEQAAKAELLKQNEKYTAKIEELNREASELKKENTKHLTTKEQRDEEYRKTIDRLSQWEERLDKKEMATKEQRENEARQHFEKVKETWKKHQDDVANTIKGICHRHQIEYLSGEKTPFRGRPDNTITICGEYIIFDAKSPEGEDLGNFPLYIKTQAEAAKKYAKQENVKKDIYLVIPANTSEAIENKKYDFADYTAWVITTDSLEPIILALKKIEEYEFTEQLSPEEREQICRVLGKFIHATKRRIQVDQYFWCEFMGALSGVQALPTDFFAKVQHFERSAMMNPPQERRAKEIPVGELKQHMKVLEQDAKGKGINVGEPRVALIETVPLYLEQK